MSRRRRDRIILLPFLLLWRLACALVKMIGRLAAIALGVVLIVVGLVLSLTILGAIIGIPMMILGVMLLTCALR